jgi:hypothetical protein
MAYLERPRTIPIGKLILHKAVIIDICHQPYHGLGLHVSIPSSQTGQSDRYPLHDDVHELRLVVSSIIQGAVEVDQMPRTRDL